MNSHKSSERRWIVGKSKIHGKGVIATQSLRPQQVVGVLIDFKKPNTSTSIFNSNESIGVGELDGERRLFIITSDLGVFVNHQPSDKANTVCVRSGDIFYLVTAKHVRKGNELTLDYDKLPPFLQKSKSSYI